MRNKIFKSKEINVPENLQKGFVILFTVLVSSIVLAIALGITNIALKEVLLSGSARDGEYAFFAADTGAECALYWDIKHAAFGQTPIVPDCRGSSVTMTASSSPFIFNFDSASGCAVVTVDKSDPTITKIESLGYNMDCNVLQTTPENPRIVERAIRVTYGAGEAPSPEAPTSIRAETTTPPPSSILAPEAQPNEPSSPSSIRL